MNKSSTPTLRISLIAILMATAFSASAKFSVDKGTLSEDEFENAGLISAISGNGSILAGQSKNDMGLLHAAVWSDKGWKTKTDLGTLNDVNGNSAATGINNDGSVIIGESDSTDGQKHAILWSGNNWTNKLALLEPTNTKSSHGWGLSRDGSVAIGYSVANDGYQHPLAWSGDNYGTLTDLGSLRSGKGGAVAFATNANGSVIVGSSQQDGFRRVMRAIAWSGSNWSEKTALGTVKSDNSGNSFAYGVTDDGSIIVGWSDSDSGVRRPVVWKGTNWQNKQILGEMTGGNSASGFAQAISADGSVIGGLMDGGPLANGERISRATIWTGEGYQTIIDLGTLKSDNSGTSNLRGLSADGRVAVGSSQNDREENRATIWLIANGTPIDSDNTQIGVSTLTNDTFAVLASRKQAVRRLTADCQAENGHFCYSAGYDYHRSNQHTRNHSANLLLGYGVSDSLTAGLSLSTPLAAKINETHRVKNGVGVGVFARFHGTLENGEWYLTPAIAFDSQKLRVNRPHLEGTEDASNQVKAKSTAYSLTFGQDFGSAEKFFGWYSALRYDHVKRAAYTETVSSFPFAYDAAKLSETTFALGMKTSLPILTKLTWESSAELEQRLAGGKAKVAAQENYFGEFEQTLRTRSLRPSAQTGFGYALTPTTKISVGGYVSRAVFDGTDKGAFLKVSGSF